MLFSESLKESRNTVTTERGRISTTTLDGYKIGMQSYPVSLLLCR